MRKEDLRKLRALSATKEMMDKGKRYSEYALLARVQNLKGYIKVALFLSKDVRKDIKTPRYEIFINTVGKEYITRELDEKGEEKRWLKGMVSNLPEIDYYSVYYEIYRIYLNKDAKDTLQSLQLDNIKWQESKGLVRLWRWQQEQLNKKTRAAEAKEQKPWDEDMKLIPKLPKSFNEWMRRDVVKDVYIFYDYTPKGATEGYCSRCQKIVPIKHPKAGKMTRCSRCGASAMFKTSGKYTGTETATYYANIMQKIKGGIVVREYNWRYTYRGKPYTDPHIWENETERLLILNDGTVKRYYYGMYKQKYLRWILDKDYHPAMRTYYYTRSRMLYRRNMASLRKTEILRNSAVGLWEVLPTSVTNYLEIEKGNPAVEMLARIGMFELAKDLMSQIYDKDLLDQDATELSKMLKIDKSRLKRMRAVNGNITLLRWLQLEKRENTMWPDAALNNLAVADLAPTDFDFLKYRTGGTHAISPIRLENYLQKQSDISKDTVQQVMTTWEDYTNMAHKLKMDVKKEQIAMPKDLNHAHGELILILQSGSIKKQVKEIEKKWPKVNVHLKRLEKFEYESDGYCIVAPKKVYDIVQEGVILSHCVHTCDYYFDRIQRDESYLFFLRKANAPDMPWYTLEVEPSGNIRQKRTTGDNQNPDFEGAKPFLKKWQRYFKKQLNAEEKKLGVKADTLRKENYKQLRTNGNRVWHGKLAGQLLADVLEADFMSAE